MLPRRQQLLRDAIAVVPRELVVCFGKVHWAAYENIFALHQWSDKSPFRVSVEDGMRIVLTTDFADCRFNTDTQLVEFAQITGLSQNICTTRNSNSRDNPAPCIVRRKMRHAAESVRLGDK